MKKYGVLFIGLLHGISVYGMEDSSENKMEKKSDQFLSIQKRMEELRQEQLIIQDSPNVDSEDEAISDREIKAELARLNDEMVLYQNIKIHTEKFQATVQSVRNDQADKEWVLEDFKE